MSLRLLCVTAHPDDECFAFGGALALAADRGVEVTVVCLTAGQAGSYRGDASTPKELGELRRAEFAASCAVLGVKDHEMLDYQDGQLEFASLSKLAQDIVERIRRIRPQVVLTFGGDGSLNTHADHTIVSAAATAAFHWAGSPKRFAGLGELWTPQRLYYQTTSYFLPDRLRPLPAPWTLTLDIRSVSARKLDAFRAHATQRPLLDQVEPLFQKLGQHELYTLAASMVPQPAAQSTDMFEGIGE
jgi:LmbE family N-acetylglucosaminyl deacetylase